MKQTQVLSPGVGQGRGATATTRPACVMEGARRVAHNQDHRLRRVTAGARRGAGVVRPSIQRGWATDGTTGYFRMAAIVAGRDSRTQQGLPVQLSDAVVISKLARMLQNLG